MLTAKQISKGTNYADVWSSFSDMCTESVESETIEQIEYHVNKRAGTTEQIPRRNTVPVVVNIHPPLAEHSLASRRSAIKSAQPQVYKKGNLPTSITLSPAYSFHNRRYLESVSLTKKDSTRSKLTESVPHRRLSHSTDITISWHKYGKHVEPVLHIDAY